MGCGDEGGVGWGGEVGSGEVGSVSGRVGG